MPRLQGASYLSPSHRGAASEEDRSAALVQKGAQKCSLQHYFSPDGWASLTIPAAIEYIQYVPQSVTKIKNLPYGVSSAFAPTRKDSSSIVLLHPERSFPESSCLQTTALVRAKSNL